MAKKTASIESVAVGDDTTVRPFTVEVSQGFRKFCRETPPETEKITMDRDLDRQEYETWDRVLTNVVPHDLGP